MFSSLAVPNYRKYYLGQVVSRTGTLMQQFAQSWLVYDLTGSATMVGLTVAVQNIPILLVGPYAGLVADRLDKRRLMIFLQAMMGVLAVALGALTLTHTVQLWHVFVLALLLGTNEAFDNPSRLAFVFEMVGPRHITNAVGLNSVLNNISRAVGPAIGAGVVATLGLGMCFLLNAVSFGAVIVSLVVIDRSQLHAALPTRRAKGQLREGFGYVRRSSTLWVPLGMMALIGTLTWEFQTTLPPMASQVLHGGATAYGLMIAMQGVGAIGGGLTVAARGRAGPEIADRAGDRIRRRDDLLGIRSEPAGGARHHGAGRFRRDELYVDGQQHHSTQRGSEHARSRDESLDDGGARLYANRRPARRRGRDPIWSTGGDRSGGCRLFWSRSAGHSDRRPPARRTPRHRSSGCIPGRARFGVSGTSGLWRRWIMAPPHRQAPSVPHRRNIGGRPAALSAVRRRSAVRLP